MLDVIVIGAGPSGLCASIYASRFNLEVGIFEFSSPGGQMTRTEVINNYPGFTNITGYDLATNMLNQAITLGVKYYPEEVIKVEKDNQNDLFKVTSSNGFNTFEYITKSIIIASGTKEKTLGLDSENKFFYKGISWCAICDGPLYKNKNVCVIGGGASAISSALTLSKYASCVYLIHRREEFRAPSKDLELLKSKENVKIITNANVTEFIGLDKLEKVKICEKSQNEEKIYELPVECAFECVGSLPNTAIFKSIIDLNDKGYIITSNEMKTSMKGIFACGDCREKELRQITTAVSDGAIAAVEANKYISCLSQVK